MYKIRVLPTYAKINRLFTRCEVYFILHVPTLQKTTVFPVFLEFVAFFLYSRAHNSHQNQFTENALQKSNVPLFANTLAKEILNHLLNKGTLWFSAK